MVATMAGSTSTVVKDGESGLLCGIYEDNKFYLNLLRLVDDKNLRIEFGKTGMAHVKKHFSIQRLVDDTDHLYQNLLNPSK